VRIGANPERSHRTALQGRRWRIDGPWWPAIPDWLRRKPIGAERGSKPLEAAIRITFQRENRVAAQQTPRTIHEQRATSD
jgi:hypothetical protein